MSSIPDSSFSISFIGISSLRLCDRAIYSASTVLSAISVCSLLVHSTGQFAYSITNPVLDLHIVGSFDISAVYVPAKSASTYQFSCFRFLLGCMIIPLVLVPSKYLHIRFIASSWARLGLD